MRRIRGGGGSGRRSDSGAPTGFRDFSVPPTLWVLALATLMIAGCGAPELEELEGGRAGGPGFSFELGSDWRAVSDLDQASEAAGDEIEEAIPGLDFESGLQLAGLWVRTDNRTRRPVINVVIEPVTPDTTLRMSAIGNSALLEESGRTDEVSTRRSNLAGSEAVVFSYRSDDDETIERILAARRGPYEYAVTVRMRTSSEASVEDLLDSVASTWSWEPRSEADRGELRGLRELEGNGYRVLLPPGWRATGRDALDQLREADPGDLGELPGVDSLWRGHFGRGHSTNAQVRIDPAPATSLEEAVRMVMQAERTNITAMRQAELLSIGTRPDVELGGLRAGTVAIRARLGGLALSVLEVVALHDGDLYTVTLAATPNRFARDRRAFLRTLESWRWTT